MELGSRFTKTQKLLSDLSVTVRRICLLIILLEKLRSYLTMSERCEQVAG